jgi:ABC-type nitrate/sulfonate/bicarbonate transport system permease component
MNNFTVIKLKIIVVPFLLPCLLLIIWLIVSNFFVINQFYLPKVSQVVDIIFSFNYLTDFGETLYRTCVGFLIAAFFGIICGIFIGLNKKLFHLLEGTIEFFRALPATALIPLFLLFFGIGDFAKIAISVFVCFWIIQINTIYGVWSIHHLTLKIGKIYNISRYKLIKEIIIPAALPQISTGLRISISLSLIVIVVTEMFIGTKFGLGQKIYDSYITYRIADLYAYTIIVGLLGYVLNKLFNAIETRIIHWSGK